MNKLMIGASVLALVAGINAANAATSTDVLPAGERLAADHAPMGVRAGSFLIIPQVDVEETYNDNIYATTRNEKSDFITTVRPQVAARSNWNRHALNAVARGEFQKYSDNGDEDQSNYLAAVDGRVDVMRETSIGGGIAYSRDHEERGNPNTIGNPAKPTTFDSTVARIGAYRGLGKANARFDSQVKNIDYKNNYSNAGTLINNNTRDRNEYSQTLRLGYQIDDRFEAFVRGIWDTRVYDNKAVARGNHGQTYVAGTTFDISGKTKGEVYAGTTRRNYTNSALKDIDEPTWGGKLTWNATDLTTVIASIDRGIEETTLAGSSGYVGTDYNVGVEHALTRDVLLKAKTGFTTNDYNGNVGTQRKDKVWTAGVGADYWMNRCLKAGLSYAYTDRDSNISGGDFGRNTVMLRLTATY